MQQVLRQFTPELRRRFHIEVIVSDGGSKDKTVDLARSVADVVVEWNCDEVQTISQGRNLGAAAARGKILIRDNFLGHSRCRSLIMIPI